MSLFWHHGHRWFQPPIAWMWYALELKSFSHGYGQITYHLVLVPKYRYKIFYDKQIKKDCELIFNNICNEQGYKIHALEIVDDHIHLFVEFHPSNSLSEVVQYLKGGSSYRLFKLHPELKKRYWDGSLWSSGKFYRSVGNVTAETIKHYIKESQKKPKAEFNSSKSIKLGQRIIEDFWLLETERAARSIPHPLGWGGRTQFDLWIERFYPFLCKR